MSRAELRPEVTALSPAAGALPAGWPTGWGAPTGSLSRHLAGLREGVEALAADLSYVDRSSGFADLVGSAELRNSPIHRWYYYKEGFSPRLPSLLVQLLGTGNNGVVVDPFAGVGTTALSLRQNNAVSHVVSVEYSPFACFVAQAKLASLSLESRKLLRHAERLRNFGVDASGSNVPSLAAFHNAEIFAPEILHTLLAARDQVRTDKQLSEGERAFFLLGIVAVVEDLSGAMKDGRALRILRGRKRRRQGLRPRIGSIEGSDAHTTIVNQWLAMIEDVEVLQGTDSHASTLHVRGDARSLVDIRDDHDREVISSNSVGMYLYSPPYLNCIDYTEVYKLELWLLELVSDQKAFRALREGTLRSHPSIEFPERPRVSDDSKVFSVIDAITGFLTDHLSRPSVGRVHGYYFADMYEVLREQYRTLEHGGSIACIVANSTFSRRVKENDRTVELWRVPILTDVILARLAEAAGFTDIEIWGARTLQAKNVNGGFARESIVVARKST